MLFVVKDVVELVDLVLWVFLHQMSFSCELLVFDCYGLLALALRKLLALFAGFIFDGFECSFALRSDLQTFLFVANVTGSSGDG